MCVLIANEMVEIQLLEVELNRDLKKEPEVEFEIPKRIFTTEDGNELNPLGQLFTQVVESRA
jgi:U3 small nucleolar RNA-associated protein 19